MWWHKVLIFSYEINTIDICCDDSFVFKKHAYLQWNYALNLMSSIPGTATLVILRKNITSGIQGNAPETHANQCEQHKQFDDCFQIS